MLPGPSKSVYCAGIENAAIATSDGGRSAASRHCRNALYETPRPADLAGRTGKPGCPLNRIVPILGVMRLEANQRLERAFRSIATAGILADHDVSGLGQRIELGALAVRRPHYEHRKGTCPRRPDHVVRDLDYLSHIGTATLCSTRSWLFSSLFATPACRSDSGMWMAANEHKPKPMAFRCFGRSRSVAWPLKFTYSVPPSAPI